MTDRKAKTGFWIDKKILADMEELMPEAMVESKSEFVSKAMKFYIGYLRSSRAEIFMLPVFNNVIHATIRNSEDRIVSILFKLAVEVAMMNRIIGYDKKFSDNALEQIRDVAIDEVRRILH